MGKTEKYFQANKINWNKRVDIHFNSNFYDNNNFLISKNSLNQIELDELSDIAGKDVLHLQCHFGQDTISLANLGANATGVDFSDKAISKAIELSKKSKVHAEFICSNIYDLKENLDKKFDFVFTSYGTIGWLPDIEKWAEIVSHFLSYGGSLILVEFHPFIWMFDDQFNHFQYSYFHNKSPIEETVDTTYTDGEEKINLPQYSWNHTLSDVTNSLINNGMEIISFKEFEYSPYNCFPEMIEFEKGKYIFKKFGNKIPLIYMLRAEKK